MPWIPSLRRALPATTLLALLPRVAPGQDTTVVRPPDRAAAPVARVTLPPPVPPPWRFQVDVGFQAIGGNRDLTVANTTFIVERRPQDRLILNFKFDARYGRSNGVEAVNTQSAKLRFDWNPRNVVSPFLGLEAVRDPVRSSALRLQGGTGFNFNVDVRDAHRTWFSVGTVWDHEVFIDTTSAKTDVRWMLRAATQQLVGQSTRIEALAKIQPTFRDARNYLAALEASVRVALTHRMGLTTKLELKRDSRPAIGVEPDDRSVTVALSLAW